MIYWNGDIPNTIGYLNIKSLLLKYKEKYKSFKRIINCCLKTMCVKSMRQFLEEILLSLKYLQHSHVALLINNGEDPYMIKEWIGHASIQIIYDLYGHLYTSKQISTADKLDSMY